MNLHKYNNTTYEKEILMTPIMIKYGKMWNLHIMKNYYFIPIIDNLINKYIKR